MLANVGNASAVWRFGFLCYNRTRSSLCLRNDEWVRDLFSRLAFLTLKILLEMAHSEYAGYKLDLFYSGVREQVFVIICPRICEFGLPAVSQLSQDFSRRQYPAVFNQLIEPFP